MDQAFKKLSYLVFALIVSPLPSLAAMSLPNGGFISAPNRADIAYDTRHGVLYISGESLLLRFDMKAKEFLSPIALGGTTKGMDISPDGVTLAVANSAHGSSQNYVDLINLDTGSASRAAFNLESLEGGTYAVAYDEQSKLVISSEFEGSGTTPLRKYDPVAKTTSVLGNVGQDTMLAASADRSVVAVAETNGSDGPWGVYHTGDTSYSSQHHLYDPVTGGTGSFNLEIGISRDGRQISIPTYNGTFVGDEHSVKLSLGEYAGAAPIGVAYSPLSDIVYFPLAQTDHIGVYDTNTLAMVGQFTVPGQFDWPASAFEEGRTKVSSDGHYLFSTLDNGVFFSALSPIPEPHVWAMMLFGFALLSFFGRIRALS